MDDKDLECRQGREVIEALKESQDLSIINITTDTVKQIEEMEKAKYLAKHNHRIWKAADGKWKTYVDDTSKRGYSLKTRNSKENLEKFIVKWYRQKEEDPYIEQVFEKWNQERLNYGEIGRQSYTKYANDFARFFTKDCILRKKRMRLITEEDLESFIKATINVFQMTRKTYSNMRTILRGVFMYGKKKGYTTISISSFFGDLYLSKRIFKRRIVNKEDEVFSEDEVKLITEYLRKHADIRNLGILLDFETGVRVGELSALKKADVMLTKRTIHVQRTEITYKDAETNKSMCVVKDFPKTDAGDRYLTFPETAVATLKAIWKLNPQGEYLFEANGKRIRGNAFNRKLDRVCDALNLNRRSMHKIRKTYATTLLNYNVDESIIAEQMGHKDIATTLGYYYFSNKNEARKREQINRAISC